MYGIHPLVVFDTDDQNTSFSDFNPFIIQFKQDVEHVKDLTSDLLYAKEQVQIMKEVFEKIHKHEIETVQVAEKQPHSKIDKRMTVAMRKQQFDRMSKQLTRRITMYKQGILEDHDFFKNYAFPLRQHKWILQQPVSAHYIKDAYYIHLLMDYKVLLRRHDKTDTRTQFLSGNYKLVIHKPFLSIYFPLPKSMIKVQFMNKTCCYTIDTNHAHNPSGLIHDILIGLHDCQASILLQDIMHRFVLEARHQSSKPFKGDPLIETNDVVVEEEEEAGESIYWEWKYPNLELIQWTLFIGKQDVMLMTDNDPDLLHIIKLICKQALLNQTTHKVGLFDTLQDVLTEYVNIKHVNTVLHKIVKPLQLPFKASLNDKNTMLELEWQHKKTMLHINDFKTFTDVYSRTFDISHLEVYLAGYVERRIKQMMAVVASGLEKRGLIQNRLCMHMISFVICLKSSLSGDVIVYSTADKAIKHAMDIDLKSDNIMDVLHELIH